MKRVTLQDVADRAGCTAPGVSYVLGGGPMARRFRPELRERIHEAAAALGNRANAAARAMATGRFRSVTLLMGTDTDHSPMPAGLIHGVMDELNARRYSLTIARLTPEQLDSDAAVPEVISQLASDGVLMDYNSEIPPGLVKVVKRHRIPIIWINSDIDFDAVRPDDFGGAKQLTHAMLSAGNRRIAFAHSGIIDRHYSVNARYLGYASAMQEAGLQPVRHFVTGVAISDRLPHALAWERDVKRWLAKRPAPTAIVCYGGEDVWAVRLAAESAGIRIPDDLLVSPFGAWGSRRTEFGFDALRAVVPEYEVGRQAVSQLLRIIETGKTRQPAVVVPMSLEGPVSSSKPRRQGSSPVDFTRPSIVRTQHE